MEESKRDNDDGRDDEGRDDDGRDEETKEEESKSESPPKAQTSSALMEHGLLMRERLKEERREFSRGNVRYTFGESDEEGKEEAEPQKKTVAKPTEAQEDTGGETREATLSARAALISSSLAAHPRLPLIPAPPPPSPPPPPSRSPHLVVLTLQSSPPLPVRTKTPFRRYVSSVPESPSNVYCCLLTRSKCKLSGAEFSFTFDDTRYEDLVMYAKRRFMPANYIISLDKLDLVRENREDRSGDFLGKMKVKKTGTEFVQVRRRARVKTSESKDKRESGERIAQHRPAKNACHMGGWRGGGGYLFTHVCGLFTHVCGLCAASHMSVTRAHTCVPLQQDQGINPGRLLDNHEDIEQQSNRERGSMSGYTAEEKENERKLDGFFTAREELACVIRKEDKQLDMLINVGIPKVQGFGREAVRSKWQGMTRDQKLTHNTEVLGDRGARNDLMKDQLEIFGGYEKPERGVGRKDHRGRRAVASEKNFKVTSMVGGDPGIYSDPVDKAEKGADKELGKAISPMLEMMKVGKEVWSVRYTHPFTMLQAFGVALTRFEM